MRAFAIATAALLLFSGSFNNSAGAQQVTALTNATLIDGSGAAPQSGATIVMQGGRITAIGRDVKAPAGAAVVDLTGKYVVPGIINGHGHVGPAPHERQVRQYALYGVTTTTSLASDPDAIAEYKARTRAGDIRGARVLTTMYRFTTMQAPGAGYDYRTPEAARAKVDENAARGADMLKVWIDPQGGKIPRLSREMVTAIVDQGRKHNLITGAHIVELGDANMAIDEGVRILLHNVRDQEVGADFIARLKDRNITVISTLAREEGLFVYGSDGAGFTDNPFFTKSVPPERMAVLTGKIREAQAKMPGRERAIRAFETDKKNLKKMADAGVRFGFGTDSGGDPNRFFVQGFFEHRQMELMVQAGLTPMQVIQAFSRNNAEAFGIQNDYGTLALGKAADSARAHQEPARRHPQHARARGCLYRRKKIRIEQGRRTMSMIHRVATLAAIAVVFGIYQSGGTAQTVPRFEIDAKWPKDLPGDWITGRLGGVCMDAKGDNVFVVNRADITEEEKETSTSAPSIIKFNAAGDVVASWGNQKTVPGSIHGCFVDLAGNVWVAGNGDAMIQKYDPAGKLLMQIGQRGKFDSADGTRKGKGNNSAKDQLHMPAAVVIDPDNGDIFVADGYGNRRVIVFDKDGKFLRQWGRQATDEETQKAVPGVFAQVVHCIHMSATGLLYVCDRQGNRVQVFRKDGSFVRNIPIPNKSGKLPDNRGTAWWVAFSPDKEQRYLYVMNGGTEQVHILDHKSGDILSSFGRPGHQIGNFTHGHTITVDLQGSIYVAETDWGRRIQKFRLVK